MNTLTSRDDTIIAYDKAGSGPAVVLVDAALTYRKFGPNVALAKALAQDFTVYTYDRRGRGESGDTLPYSPEREIDDLQAVVDAAGGSVYLYGISSGGGLALEAVRRLGKKVKKLALYEVPFVVDDSRPPVPADYVERLKTLIAAGKRSQAAQYFMSAAANFPKPLVALFPLFPGWSSNKALAHTLIYDAAFEVGHQNGKPLPTDEWTYVTQPTLVLDGGKSPAWLRNASHSLADVLHADYQTLPGQIHVVKADAMAPALTAFFKK
jgi:pimeloyl-ACP methyl ester carboxylesterase